MTSYLNNHGSLWFEYNGVECYRVRIDSTRQRAAVELLRNRDAELKFLLPYVVRQFRLILAKFCQFWIRYHGL
jgi:hypothetical protein